MKHRLCTLLLAGLMAWTGLALAQQFTPGDVVVRRVSGNSIIGDRQGIRFCVFYEPGGRYYVRSTAGDYMGQWWPDGRLMCTKLQAGPSRLPRTSECHRVLISGDNIEGYEPGGAFSWYGRILPGNQC